MFVLIFFVSSSNAVTVEITAQKEGNRRKSTSDQAWTQDLRSIMEFSQDSSVPVANPSSDV